MEFKNIKNKIIKDYNEQQAKDINQIKNAGGFSNTWSKGYTAILDTNGKHIISIDATLTNLQAQKTLEEQKTILVKKLQKHYNNKVTKLLQEVEEVEQAPEQATFLKLSIDWARSATWGMNPTATLWSNGEYIEGSSVGGCGYDKESTASAQVLNQCKGVLKLLYAKYDEYLQATPEQEQKSEFLSYGVSAYNLPRFNGGVGINCHINNLERLGFKLQASHSSKYNNYYYFEKITA